MSPDEAKRPPLRPCTQAGSNLAAWLRCVLEPALNGEEKKDDESDEEVMDADVSSESDSESSETSNSESSSASTDAMKNGAENPEGVAYQHVQDGGEQAQE